MESLLEPEFETHYANWQADPSPVNNSAMLKAIDPVLNSALRSYGGKKPSPNLRSHAKLLALDALKRYDPNRAKLRTHLMVNLQGLRRLNAREAQTIPLPERVSLDLHHVRQAENELQDRLGRTASDLELSDHTGISAKRLEYIRRAHPSYSESQIIGRTEEGDETALDPAVMDPNDDTWLRFVYHDLHPIDQIILEHSVGLNGKRRLSKQKIAVKLGLSSGAVSQRARRIQALLDKREELGSFL